MSSRSISGLFLLTLEDFGLEDLLRDTDLDSGDLII